MSIVSDSSRGIGNGTGSSTGSPNANIAGSNGGPGGYARDARRSPVPPPLRGLGLGFLNPRPSIDGGSPDPNVPALTLQRPSEPTSLPPLEYLGQPNRGPPPPPHGSHSFARDGPSHGLASSSSSSSAHRLPSLSSMHSHPSSGLRGTYDGSAPPSPTSSAATTPTPIAPFGSTHSSSSPASSRPFASGPPSPTNLRNGGGSSNDASFPISRQLAPLSLNNSGPGTDGIDKSPLNTFPRPSAVVSPPHAHPPARPSPLSSGVLPPLHHQRGPSPGPGPGRNGPAGDRDFYARRESLSEGYNQHQLNHHAQHPAHLPRPPGIPTAHPPHVGAVGGEDYPVRRHSIAVFQDSHELPGGIGAGGSAGSSGASSLRMRVAGHPSSSGSSLPLARRGSLYPRHAPTSNGTWPGSGDLPPKIEEDVDMDSAAANSKTRLSGGAPTTSANASSTASGGFSGNETHVSDRRSSLAHPELGRKRKSVQEGVNIDRPPYTNHAASSSGGGEPSAHYLPQQPIHSSPPSFKPPLAPGNKQQPTFLNPFQTPAPPGPNRQHSHELLPPPAKRRGSAYDTRSIPPPGGNMLPPGPNDYYSHADAFRRDSAASMYSHSSSQGGYVTSNTSYSIMDEKPAHHGGANGGGEGAGAVGTSEMWPERVSPGNNNDDKSSSPSGSSNGPNRRHLSTLPKSARDAVLSAGHAGYSRSPELRESHKMAERKRRKDMKVMFDELLEVLPPERHPKTSKWEILSRCVDYIRDAESHAAHMRQNMKGLQQENEYLRSQLRGAGGPLPPPSNGHFDGPNSHGSRRNESLTLPPLASHPSSTEHSSSNSSAVDYSPQRSP